MVSRPVPRLESFKAYDIRGRVPDELNEEMTVFVGRAFARLIRPRRVVVGHDMRLTGERLAAALARGLTDAGVDVVDIGLVGTEQVYFATFHLGVDGGVMVTASHNPAEYNGMKFVREQAIPVSSDTGLLDMEKMVAQALAGYGPVAGPYAGGGNVERRDISEEYIEHLLTYVDESSLQPLRIVANAGNGMAGPVVRMLQTRLPFQITLLYPEPDGTFPHGVPNPLLPEKREDTARAVREHGADMGLAWDGDFDRCFFYDATGGFIEGYYMVGLLAQEALRRYPGSKIIHDPRLVWYTTEVVKAAGGIPLVNKSGHAFIKERMRREDAVYGGEMSAHHYFREFSYCDSGMIPWLLVADILSRTGRPLSELIGEAKHRYPASGELNLRLKDPVTSLRKVRRAYEDTALSVDEIDGLSMEFSNWRFNVRISNTEPVVRVNVESREDPDLMRRKTEEVIALLKDGA